MIRSSCLLLDLFSRDFVFFLFLFFQLIHDLIEIPAPGQRYVVCHVQVPNYEQISFRSELGNSMNII